MSPRTLTQPSRTMSRARKTWTMARQNWPRMGRNCRKHAPVQPDCLHLGLAYVRGSSRLKA